MQYYGTRLSENISRREPEGYLLCLNVPVARTGIQEYLPEELGLSSASEPLPVLRLPEEVFSPETIASFEGMPVTNNHPPEGVTAENIRALQKGHAHNVRRGSGEESDLLLADLIITDPELTRAILDGKREISCGYTYELCAENGKYVQRKIRGNHVAVVDAGRAGPRVSIKDEQPSESPIRVTAAMLHERSTSPMKKSLAKVLARIARDGDIETAAELIEEILEPELPAEPAPEPETEETLIAVPEEKTITVDEDLFPSLLERLDRIIALLSPAPAADEESPEAGAPAEAAEEAAEAVEEAAEAAGADPAEAEEIAEMVEQILDPTVSTVLEPDPEEAEAAEKEAPDSAEALRAALSAFRPFLRKMDRRERSAVCSDIAVRLNRSRGKDSALSALASMHRPEASPADLGRKIMARRNPNYRE